MEKVYCVYKISCKDSNIKHYYFGSTSNFYMRMANHKHNVNNYKGTKHHFPLYKFMRESGGWSNWECEIIHDNLAKDDARNLEKEYVLNNEYSLNQLIPARTNKEWRQANPEKIKIYSKKSYAKNPQYWQQYYQKRKDEYLEKIECECGTVVSKIHLIKHCRTISHNNYLESQQE